jgi:hypothetical protein
MSEKTDHQEAKAESDSSDAPKGFWTRRKDNTLTKGKKVVGWGAIEDGANVLKAYGGLLDPRRKREAAHVETFEESCARFDVDEPKLKVSYNGMMLQFYCAVALTVGLVGWMFYMAWAGHFFASVVVSATTMVPIALALTTAFRLHQLAIRRWCTFGEWVGSKGGWWPQDWHELELERIESEKKQRDSRKNKT